MIVAQTDTAKMAFTALLDTRMPRGYKMKAAKWERERGEQLAAIKAVIKTGVAQAQVGDRQIPYPEEG